MSDRLPLVSILIPCYNCDQWVRQCIESALAQTYPNREVIVVDDGSTDRSWEIISSFGGRIQCEQQSNCGANVSRNRLLDLSRGEWLQYLDADDELLSTKLEKQVQVAISRHESVDLVYSPLIVRDENRGKQYAIHIDPEADSPLNFIRWTPFGTLGMLFKAEALRRLGGWKPDQPCCQEHEVVLRMLLGGSSIGLENSPCCIYRQYSSQTISKKHPLRTLQQRMALTDSMENHLRTTQTLTRSHQEALAVSRIEAARSAFEKDRSWAVSLFRRARQCDGWHRLESPATPRSYRIACRLLGFVAAEKLAAGVRPFRRRFVRLE